VARLYPSFPERAFKGSECREVKGCLGWFSVPKGQEDSAQGFNPGNRTSLRRALKGRQIECVNSTHLTNRGAHNPAPISRPFSTSNPADRVFFLERTFHVPCEHPTWLAPSVGRKELLVPEKGESPYLMVPRVKTLG
jgi:hypothetical protein